jgi:hypothetical protein
MPPSPSVEWIRLQFVPNNETVKSASLFTGRLGVKRAVQTRTLRKAHPDQHWVNCMMKYVYEWLIELNRELNGVGVEFFGQDDKAKIPVGDSVAISTGVRANVRSAIVSADGGDTVLNAMDHDFHRINLVLSVTLRCNIPASIGGSFFMGDEDDGNGRLFYTLRDAVFDPSRIFDHTAQLVDCVKRSDLNPYVLVLQTDGGPDHSIKFATTKNAMIALFKILNLDHLLILRGAPNGSAYNKIERAMSPANSALANVSIKRGVMPDWAEDLMKNANSMSEIRATNENHEKAREDARKRIHRLDMRLLVLAIKTLTANIFPDQEAESVNEFTKGVLDYIGAWDDGISLDGTTDVIELEDGSRKTRSTATTHTSIAKKKAAAQEIVSRDFRAE